MLAMSQTTSTITIVLLAVLVMAMRVASGPGAAPPSNGGLICGANLGLCAESIAGGKPSDECCASLDTAFKKELKCLCGFLTNPQVLASFNLTVDTALLIPKSCGIDAGSSMCSEPKAPLPQVPSVPGPPKGAATKLAGTGLVGVLTTISIMFY